MAKGSTKGSRVIVKLPWKGTTDNENQFVRIKKPVAQALGFTIANTSDLTYDRTVKKKDKSSTDKVAGTEKVKAIRLAGYRQRSVTVKFKSKKSINGKSVQTVSFPITPSVSVYEMVKYFETGAGKSVGVALLITDKGQTYPINS